MSQDMLVTDLPPPDPATLLEAKGKPRFTFYTLAELAERPPQRFLIDEVLIANAFALLYGQPGSYKSFVALDWALSIASGQDWQGFGVEQGPVVYIASEGEAGLGKRAQAWHVVHKHADLSNFYVLPDTVRALHAAEVAAFLEILPAKPALVVIDTLSRSLSGGNENGPDDMGKFVDFCERIRRETGAAVLVVHHSEKTGQNSRGHSSLLGAVQTEIKAEASKGYMTLRCTKQKDHDAFHPISLRTRIVQLNAEGSESSIVLTPTNRSVIPLTDTRKLTLSVLQDGMTNGEWKKAALDAGVAYSTFFKAKADLIEQGYVVQDGEFNKRVSQSQASLTPSHETVVLNGAGGDMPTCRVCGNHMSKLHTDGVCSYCQKKERAA